MASYLVALVHFELHILLVSHKVIETLIELIKLILCKHSPESPQAPKCFVQHSSQHLFKYHKYNTVKQNLQSTCKNLILINDNTCLHPQTTVEYIFIVFFIAGMLIGPCTPHL